LLEKYAVELQKQGFSCMDLSNNGVNRKRPETLLSNCLLNGKDNAHVG
jgi:hypothetical protein